MQTDANLDLGVTAIANLSAARPLSAPGSRTVSGVVFEATPAGRQPVEGASVGWEALLIPLSPKRGVTPQVSICSVGCRWDG